MLFALSDAVAIATPLECDSPPRQANLNAPVPSLSEPNLKSCFCLCFGWPRTVSASSCFARGVVSV